MTRPPAALALALAAAAVALAGCGRRSDPRRVEVAGYTLLPPEGFWVRADPQGWRAGDGQGQRLVEVRYQADRLPDDGLANWGLPVQRGRMRIAGHPVEWLGWVRTAPAGPRPGDERRVGMELPAAGRPGRLTLACTAAAGADPKLEFCFRVAASIRVAGTTDPPLAEREPGRRAPVPRAGHRPREER